MTGFEKQIYNTWLATTRSNQNKPFKLRKEWKGFEDKPEYYFVKKLAKLFTRYDNININEWFEAPYKIYPEKIQYDLKHYTLMKQYQTYRLYIQKKINKKLTPKQFHDILFKNKKS
jgi:hypothetical protein